MQRVKSKQLRPKRRLIAVSEDLQDDYGGGDGDAIIIQQEQANNNNRMLEQLKHRLTGQCSSQSILEQLSQPALVHNLRATHLQELVKIVEGKVSGIEKVSPKVGAAIYSIIVMKNYPNYNTKLAVEALTNQAREAAGTPSARCPEDKARRVVASLLLRIPSFSNYKLTIRDISPELAPASLILQHRASMCSQCPNLYKEHLLARHRYAWYQLTEGDQQSCPIAQDLAAAREGLTDIASLQDSLRLYNIAKNIEDLLQFTRNRIGLANSQQLLIEELCQQLQQILTFTIAPTTERKLLPLEIAVTQDKLIRNIKSSAAELLRVIIMKYGVHLMRKMPWLLSLLRDLLARPYDEYSISPGYLIDLCRALLEKFGLGIYDFDTIVKNEDGWGLSLLISALCLNDYSQNNRKQTALLNYQAPKGQEKKKNNVQISLFSTTAIDSAYEPFLKTTTPSQRELLLSKVLQFLLNYYSVKGEAAKQFYQSSQIMSALGSSKNVISQRNKQLIQQIKDKALFKGHRQIRDHFESFCEETFNVYVKKRKQKKFEVQRCLQVLIEPTKVKEVQKIQKALRQPDQQSQQNELRRTNSFDIEFQGWNNQKNSRRSEEKGEKSEMFYSIKQCSVLDQVEIGKGGPVQQPQEQEFLLTPQF